MQIPDLFYVAFGSVFINQTPLKNLTLLPTSLPKEKLFHVWPGRPV